MRLDDVTTRIRDIDVLMYDFEDYVEPETFEKDKFDTLQAAIKDLAIVLLDRIRRRRAESSLDDQVMPVPMSLFPRPPKPIGLGPATAQPARRPTSRQRMVAVPATAPHGNGINGHGHEPPQRTFQPLDQQPGLGYPGHSIPPPPAQRPAAIERSTSEGNGPQQPSNTRLRNSNADTILVGMSQLDLRNVTASTHKNSSLSPESPRSTQSTQRSMSSGNLSHSHYRSSVCTSVPETDYTQYDGELSPSFSQNLDAVADSSFPAYERPLPDLPNGGGGAKPRSDSLQHIQRERVNSINGRARATSIIGDISIDERPPATPHHSTPTAPSIDSRGISHNGSTNTLLHQSSTKTSEAGRMSVRSSGSHKQRPGSASNFGPDSSFGQMKGFCKGAQKFVAEGPGGAIKKVGGGGTAYGAAPGGADSNGYAPEMLFGQTYSSTAAFTEEMAQCAHCEYKTLYSQLSQDLKQDPLANQQSHGIHYRSRFLYKSHILTRYSDTIHFACLFCTAAGATCHEGDATVFQTPALLFRHLTRHKLPLPHILGITVLYDNVEPNQAGAQDYDLHFPEPDITNVTGDAEDEEAEYAGLPTARAVKDHVHRRNDKPLLQPPPLSTNGSASSEEVLQFLAGAKILRVEFPEKGEGKWCRGWHDGVYGVFPSKNIELDTPHGFDINAPLPKNARSAVTKWKYESKGSSSGPWLKFGRGERITSIACKCSILGIPQRSAK